jgi:hypothetical protein
MSPFFANRHNGPLPPRLPSASAQVRVIGSASGAGMRIQWTYKADAVWWNTALAIPLAFVLFFPGLLVGFVFAWLQDLLAEGYIGERGEGIGWFMRGLQFAIASGIAVSVPHLILRSSNAVIVATAFAAVLIAFGLMASFSVGEHTLREWLEVAACTVGIGLGAGVAASSVLQAQEAWKR